MDEVHRQPSEGDRNALRDRIKRAAADGRISQADADIRLGNVSTAQSMMELGLLSRELDQVESTFSAGSAAPSAPSAPSASAPAASTWSPSPEPVSGGGSGRAVPLVILGVVVALVVAGAISLFFVASGDDGAKEATGTSQTEPDLPEPQAPGASPVDPEDPESPDDPQSEEPDAEGEPFQLTAEGIRSFIGVYRAKFGTTRATDATLYPDYAVVQVPVPGKKRHSGWLYRDGEWRDFGGVSADFPGTQPIDLAKLDVAALMRNIGKARRTLNVEDINTTYVTMNFRPDFDEVPNVNIYVSNEFRESGYLATTLDGKVERAYPFAS